MNIKNRNIFKKTLFLFGGIFAPFLLCGIIILGISNRYLHQQILDKVDETTDSVIENLNEELLRIYSTAAFVAAQSSVNKVANCSNILSDYELAHNINQVREQQTTLTMANEIIDNFVIYYRYLGKGYNAANSAKGSFFTFTEEEYDELAAKSTGSYQLQFYEGELYEIINVNDAALICVSISQRELLRRLTSPFLLYSSFYCLQFDNEEGYFSDLECRNEERLNLNNLSYGSGTIWIEGEKYCYTKRDIDFLKADISYYIPEQALFKNLDIYIWFYLIFLLLTVPAVLAFAVSIRKMLFQPLDVLVGAFERIENRDYSFRIQEDGTDFTYIYRSYNAMAENIRVLIEKELQNQILLNRAELKQMQAQINPHFLYNSFFMLRDMIHPDLVEDAKKMAQALGVYFQYITRNNGDVVRLETEYRHALIYAQIQARRFEGRINIMTEMLPDKYNDWEVPRLIIQPVVENVFKYGLDNKLENGILSVRIRENEEELIICVEDNGEELTDELLNHMIVNLDRNRTALDCAEVTGIYNIQRRLVIFSEGDNYLEAERSDLGGLCMHIHLKERGNSND